jgi:dTDP-4-dehydrorhamnose reductase
VTAILLTGGTGQLGTALAGLDWPNGITLHRPGRDVLDLGRPDTIGPAFRAQPYAAIISAGAYTAVDRAETDVADAWTVNAVGPAVLAREAALAGVPIVHLSTDYVFDGTKDGPYVEADPVRPLSVYGASKEGGEQAVRTAARRHVILRTAWVVAGAGRNFLTTLLRLATDRDEVSVVADQRGCPTMAPDLAGAVQAITLRLIRDEAAPTGTFHFVNAGEATWAEFAEAIFAESARLGGSSARVRPITTAEYPTPAHRPQNSRLSTEAVTRHFGVQPRPWREALRAVLGAPGSTPLG